jgi:Protein of unknown function (DUF3303)
LSGRREQLREVPVVKYVISWNTRANASEELQARSLQVFSKWSPADGLDFQQFLGRVDGRGGYAVVETEDPTLIAKDMATFGAFFDFDVQPVLEIQESAQIGMQAVEFRNSID